MSAELRGAEVGFVPPVYPFDKLAELAELARRHEGGLVDLSIGTPCDPPPSEVLEALATSGAERGYPSSIGIGGVPRSRARMDVPPVRRRHRRAVGDRGVRGHQGARRRRAALAAAARRPRRDTVLHPALAYPTYEMGALLAGCRAVPVPARPDGTMDLASISEEDAARALCLWVNSPGNPGGQLEDLAAVAHWGRSHGVPVFSDECYIEFTWAGPRSHDPRRTAPRASSLSTRCRSARTSPGCGPASSPATPSSSAIWRSLRQHAGFMVPGPVQHAGAVALGDDAHVERQRAIYLERLERLRRGADAKPGSSARVPAGVVLPLGRRSPRTRSPRN